VVLYLEVLAEVSEFLVEVEDLDHSFEVVAVVLVYCGLFDFFVEKGIESVILMQLRQGRNPLFADEGHGVRHLRPRRPIFHDCVDPFLKDLLLDPLPHIGVGRSLNSILPLLTFLEELEEMIWLFPFFEEVDVGVRDGLKSAEHRFFYYRVQSITWNIIS
jgi:hypothetical protein